MLIELQDLGKSFGEHEVLCGINAGVEKGDRIGDLYKVYEVDGNGANNSKRQEMKELIARFRRISPVIEKNIFRSVENVNLDTIISYKKGKEIHHFLDDYDKR